MSNENREKRRWWAVSDGEVVRVIGYSCAPSNPTIWWCPNVGASLSEGHHLFAERDDAYRKAIEETEAAILATQQRLYRLSNERLEPYRSLNWQHKVKTLQNVIEAALPIVKARIADNPANEYYAEVFDQMMQALDKSKT